MKKIGVVTWFISHNYGTNLQAYALTQTLRQLNYDVRMILPEENSEKSFKQNIFSIISKLGLKDLIIRLNLKGIQRAKLDKFIRKNFSSVTIKPKKYPEILENFPVFITGSDQIWNPNYVSPFLLLDFAGNNKRIAYASSIGVSSLPENKKDLYKKCLSKFKHISLREKSGCEIVKALLPSKDVKQMIDPTFLLTKSAWASFANEAIIEFNLPDKYMLVYLIGNNDFYYEYVNSIASVNNCKIIIIKSIENETFSIPGAIHYKHSGPNEFVKLIMNSQCVCTDSFHACALSLNFSKQFYILKRFKDTDHLSQNARLYDLLDHYGLKDRIIESKIIPEKPIDYSQIQLKLSSEREYALQYIVNSIEY